MWPVVSRPAYRHPLTGERCRDSGDSEIVVGSIDALRGSALLFAKIRGFTVAF